MHPFPSWWANPFIGICFMTDMSTDFIFTAPFRFNWAAVKDLNKIIVHPDPSEDDLFNANFSPDHLEALGHKIPEDDHSAHIFSVSAFKETVNYSEWKHIFEPELPVFWPCVPMKDNQATANAIYEAGLNCVLISGNIDDVTNISGFALTAGGSDFSDHLAAAYLCSGNIPPVTVTQRALSLNRPIKMQDELKNAADMTATFLNFTVDRLNEALRVSKGPFL